MLDPAGVPAEGAVLTIVGESYRAQAMTDEEGRFEIAGVAPGEVRLLARKKGLGAAPSDPIAVAAGATVEGVEIRLVQRP